MTVAPSGDLAVGGHDDGVAAADADDGGRADAAAFAEIERVG